jgi:hypothetical protein
MRSPLNLNISSLKLDANDLRRASFALGIKQRIHGLLYGSANDLRRASFAVLI